MITVGALGAVGTAVAAAVGYRLADQPDLAQPHLLFGVFGALLLLFAHAWLLLFFGRMASVVARTVREERWGAEVEDAARRYLSRTRPWLLVAAALIFATIAVGAPVYTGAVPAWVHHLLVLLALPSQLVALTIAWRVARRHERLLRGIEQRLAEAVR